MTLSVQDLIDKRRRSWDKRHDISHDEYIIECYAELMRRNDADGKALRREIFDKPYLLIETFFEIVDKSGHWTPFFLNEVQQDFIHKLETRTDTKPFFILKGRQQGFTTLITAIQLCYALVRENFRGYTLANTSQNAQSIFNDKCKTVYNKLPNAIKQHEKYNSKHEIYFDKLNSGWRVSVASDEVGRSATLTFVHYSEAAFFECSLSNMKKAIGQAVSKASDPIEVYETTANGFNEAKELWDSGTVHQCFYPWWLTAEYRSDNLSVLETTDSFLINKIKTLREIGLEDTQIAWYCETYLAYPLDRANSIKQEYPCTPYEAFVSSGQGVFDNEMISNRLMELDHLQVAKKGFFEYTKRVEATTSNGEVIATKTRLENIKFVESVDGYITIHKEPEVRLKDNKIVARKPYTIGGDTAGNGIDFFTAKVIDNITRESVATFHKQKIDEDLYAEQMYCLGKYYNDALISLEINFSEYPMRVLNELGYPHLYMREKLGTLTDTVVKELGFRTTTKTKPPIIEHLVRLEREEQARIEYDEETLKEMLVFVRVSSQKDIYSAVEGKHDDLVMALAIGQFCSESASHEWEVCDIDAEEEAKRKEQVKEFMRKNFGYNDYSTDDSNNDGYIEW